MKWQRCVSVMAGLMLVLTASAARAEIAIDFVTVGNPGNADDMTGYGGVDDVYQIGKYEVTAGQYTLFLNDVATSSDSYGLYNTNSCTTRTCGRIPTAARSSGAARRTTTRTAWRTIARTGR